MNLIGRTMAVPMVLAFAAVTVINRFAPSDSMAARTASSLTSNPTVADDARGVRRIHAHFDSVLVELASIDVGTLSDEAAENRRTLLRTLDAYNARGVFPHNYDFAEPTPYFVDRNTGTLCAVAFLLESTGRRDIVDRVAGSNNNVWVAQLETDTAFVNWLGKQGISLAEAARIQVPYESGPSGAVVGVVVAGAGLSAATTIATSTWNAWGNRNGHNRFGTHAGITAGAVTAGFGSLMVANAGRTNGVRNAGIVTAAVGALSIGLATRALIQRPRYLAAKREQENARRTNVEASISPILPIGKESGAGLSMSIRF